MRRERVGELRCPYCGSGFRVTREVEATPERIEHGLVRCLCFEFPVVDGILLLSLAKGYGGAQEELQPYAPLLAAAIDCLGRDDVRGLRDWIARHIPLAAALRDGTLKTYLAFTAAYERTLQQDVALFLARAAHFEVVGDLTARAQLARLLPGLRSSSGILDGLHVLRARLHNLRLRRRIAKDPRAFERSHLRKYYVQRFFCPRASATSLHLRHLPMSGRILSLCSGHGVFENWLGIAGRRPAELVCIEGQIVNLFVMRYLIGVDADLICHDVQFDVPFADGWFDGVFSSTCLPEIPPQRHFASEAVRVTARSGWTAFDSIWALDSGVRRIDPTRYYRFSQNFLERPGDYLSLFRHSAGGRRVGYDVSAAPAEYLGAPRWTFDEADIRNLVDSPADTDLNALVIDESSFAGFVSGPDLDWISEDRLSLSPAYETRREGTGRNGEAIVLERVPELERLHTRFASRDFAGLPERLAADALGQAGPKRALDLYCRGIAAPLPERFDGRSRLLSEVLSGPSRS